MVQYLSIANGTQEGKTSTIVSQFWLMIASSGAVKMDETVKAKFDQCKAVMKST